MRIVAVLVVVLVVVAATVPQAGCGDATAARPDDVRAVRAVRMDENAHAALLGAAPDVLAGTTLIVETSVEAGGREPAAPWMPTPPRVRALLADLGERVRDAAPLEALPYVRLHVRDQDSLARLLAHPDVQRVYVDEPHDMHLAESLPLIHQPAAAAAGQTGTGSTVAILDTGLDWTRPAFGTCSAPGSAGCKVAYAADFAVDDGALDDNGHGTNVAGIVLGVAPGASVIALDVFRGGLAYSSDILAAIDWVVAHKDAYHIVAINMSLGSGGATSPCATDVFASAIAAARTAGIVSTISAGNDGFMDRISSPACVPAAVSVGAVYDAPSSGWAYSACTDFTVTTDRVTCFSNTASFLTLLAPGAMISAAGITMAGTSQAAPHVAGAVAVLASAFPGSTPEETINRLAASGVSVTDPRTQRALPRIDVGAAATSGAPPPAADTAGPTGTVVIGDGGSWTRTTSVTLALAASDATGVAQMCITNGATCASTAWRTAASTSAWTLAPSGGAAAVNVWWKDPLGNISATAAHASIGVDATVPTNGTVTATVSDQAATLAWSGFNDATSGVDSYRVVSALGTAPAAGCGSGAAVYQGAATSVTVTGLSNGVSVGFRVCAVDRAGNVSSGATVTARPIPETTPPVGSVALDGAPTLVKSSTVTLLLSATDPSGVAQMCISNTATCTAFVPFAATKTWTLAGGTGLRTASVWYADTWGNKSAQPATVQVNVDVTPPSNGAVTAVAGDAQIALQWSSFADVGSGLVGTRVAHAANVAPTSCAAGTFVASGSAGGSVITGLDNGVTYGVRVCGVDAAGNIGSGVTRTAKPVPETQAPTGGNVVINGGASLTKSAAVTLALSAVDDTGVAQTCISNATTCTAWVPFTTVAKWTLAAGSGVRTVRVWFRDPWGNTSAPVSAAITLDTAAPAGGVLTATAGTGKVTLAWSGITDATSGVASYRLVSGPTIPASCAAGTLLFDGMATSFVHSGLPAGTSVGYRLCATDVAGNRSVGLTKSAVPTP